MKMNNHVTKEKSPSQIGVILFPGSDDVSEILLAVRRAGMEPVECVWNEPQEKRLDLAGYIILGNAPGDAFNPLLQALKAGSALGKPILGIGYGAQWLVEVGLVPGLEDNQVGMRIIQNKWDKGAEWRYMRLSDNYQRNAFTQHMNQKNIFHLLVADGAGCFVMSIALLQEIESQGLNVFQYCDENGVIIDRANMAAISNKAGNVMAMMPHPGSAPTGDAIFHSMRDYISDTHLQKIAKNTRPLDYYLRPPI